MAIPHAASGQIVDVKPLDDKLCEARTFALFKTTELEVMRLVLPAGKSMPLHQVKGDIIVQCLEGAVDFAVAGQVQQIKAGQLLWLEGGVPHSLTAAQDASLLLTISLQKS